MISSPDGVAPVASVVLDEIVAERHPGWPAGRLVRHEVHPSVLDVVEVAESSVGDGADPLPDWVLAHC